MRSVLVRGMRPIVPGLAVGLIAVVAIASGLRSVLFGVAPADPLSLGVVAVVLLIASGVACYLPARRAASMDPLTALRQE
jgi:ABC-type antimicrobial peptide transport system permease subunit